MKSVARSSHTQHARRLLVLGAAGQLGRALLQAQHNDGCRVIGLAHAQLDTTDRQEVLGMLAELRPNLVINAAAYTAVDQAESDPTGAFAVNRDGAGNIAEGCASLNVPMIHLSTDYVFDGNKTAPYIETDEPAPVSVYGLSKAAGEQLVRERHARTVIIRTSWLFGFDGRNFVKTIVQLAKDRDELRVVADQLGRPTSADDLATTILRVSAKMLEDATLAGFYHYTGLEPITWHGFAKDITEIAASHLGRRPRVVPISTQDYPTPARRPRNSVLDCSKLTMLGIKQSSWRPDLRKVVEQLLKAESDNSRTLTLGRSVLCPTFS
jgi:dTDP-4-dehydrorhamnose reductase